MPRVEMMNLHLRAVALDGFRAQTGRAHETGDAPPADRPPGVSERLTDPGTPVPSGMPPEEAHDFCEEHPVLLPLRRDPAPLRGVETSRRDVIAATQRRYAERHALRRDEGEDVAFRAEQNRMAFFRRACSSCNWAYARSSC